MPCPFGDNDSANISPILSAPAQGDFNFETGFNTPYSAPKSNGGKFVTRMEMNAIGNLASRNDFYGMCGGLNTFSAKLASAIGGYPKGAVLDYVVGYKLYRVISLVDDNVTDFTVKGIDGVNWQYLNVDIPDIDDEQVALGNLYNLTTPTATGAIYLGTFPCKKGGIVNCVWDIDTISTVDTTVRQNYSPTYYMNQWKTYLFAGSAIAYKVMTYEQTEGTIELPYDGTSGVVLNGWKIMPVAEFTGGGSIAMKATNSSTSSAVSLAWVEQDAFSPTVPRVQAGQYIGFCYLAGCNPNGTLAVSATSPQLLVQMSARFLKFNLKAYIQ